MSIFICFPTTCANFEIVPSIHILLIYKKKNIEERDKMDTPNTQIQCI
jgi:hypothetical protein